MKKESKNLGIRKPCPGCKEVLLLSTNIPSIGSSKINFEVFCESCGKKIHIEMGVEEKPYVKATIVEKKVPNSVKVVILIIGMAVTYQIFQITAVRDTLTAMIRDNGIEYNK